MRSESVWNTDDETYVQLYTNKSGVVNGQKLIGFSPLKLYNKSIINLEDAYRIAIILPLSLHGTTIHYKHEEF